MKLASLKQGRDGRLVVVSRDLTRATEATEIAPTLQAALDAWPRRGPASALAGRLEAGCSLLPLRPSRIAPRHCRAPISGPTARPMSITSPLVRKARGAEMPATFWSDPLMYQGGSDGFFGPRDPIPLPTRTGASISRARSPSSPETCRWASAAEAARRAHRLVMLVNDVTLRDLIPSELAKGFGFFQSKPATAFSPVAVTPDELGAAWDGATLLCRCSPRQRRAVRPAERRRRHDLRFRPADRSCGADPRAGGGHDHRLRHGVESRRGRRARPADRRRRGGLFCLAEQRAVEKSHRRRARRRF